MTHPKLTKNCNDWVKIKKANFLTRLLAFKKIKLDLYESKNIIPIKGSGNLYESVKNFNLLTKKEFKMLPKISVINKTQIKQSSSRKILTNNSLKSIKLRQFSIISDNEIETKKLKKLTEINNLESPIKTLTCNKKISNILFNDYIKVSKKPNNQTTKINSCLNEFNTKSKLKDNSSLDILGIENLEKDYDEMLKKEININNNTTNEIRKKETFNNNNTFINLTNKSLKNLLLKNFTDNKF